MKVEIKETKRKQKNPSTNYSKDSHKRFCERCYAYNRGCPDTKTRRKSSSCTL